MSELKSRRAPYGICSHSTWHALIGYQLIEFKDSTRRADHPLRPSLLIIARPTVQPKRLLPIANPVIHRRSSDLVDDVDLGLKAWDSCGSYEM